MNLGAQELIVVLLIVLILFGGKKVSGLGKALGTSLREFKEEVNKADDTVKETVNTVAEQRAGTASEPQPGAKTDAK